MAVQRAAAADLDDVAERFDIGRLADDAVIELLAVRRPPIAAAWRVPLTAMPSSSPVIRNEIEPFGLPPLAAR